MTLPSFKKSKLLTVKYLEEIFKKKPTLMKYIPDTAKFRNLPRNLLFGILWSVDRPQYEELQQARNQK